MKILKLFAFWRLSLFVLTYLGSSIFPLNANQGLGAVGPYQKFDYWQSWAQWDGGHFYAIAQEGYQLDTDYAFFPLYPKLVAIVEKLPFINLLAAGLFVSNISFLASLFIFYKFTEEKYSSKAAFNSLVTLLFFPMTFFAVAFYSEGTFLFLTATAFFFLQKKRFFLSAIFVSFASLTRFVGVALIISVFYNYFSSISYKLRNVSTKILVPFTGIAGIFAYATLLFYRTNDPFKFITVQSLWQRSLNDPVSTIISYFWTFLTNASLPPDQYFDLGATLLFLSVLILGIKKISSSLWIFSVLVILIPASSGTLTSLPRYALGSLGAFIIVGSFLEDHPNLKLPLWAVALFLQVLFAVRFINGFWVA